MTTVDKIEIEKFSKLAKDASYFVRLAEDDVSLLDEANFVIMNEKNEELEQERVAETGFNFNTLPLKFNVLAGMEEEDANHLNVLRHLTSGFFDYRNLPSERTILQLLDEYDNLIETVTTGKDGQFYSSVLRPFPRKGSGIALPLDLCRCGYIFYHCWFNDGGMGQISIFPPG